MIKKDYLAYGLAILMLATIVVSAIGTMTSLSIAGTIQKSEDKFSGARLVPDAEPTVETAKVRLFVRGDAYE
ncbi:MAG: hypothetical protein AABY09_03485 [Nanoarchaeota archaeon]